MNLLVALNKKYLRHLFNMLISFDASHHQQTTCYVLSNDIKYVDLELINKHLQHPLVFHIIDYQNNVLNEAKTTYRYPKEVYYRLFAAEYLPLDVNRILYLDVDIIVLKNLQTFYDTDFEHHYFIGATNIQKILTTFNNIKNRAPYHAYYLNTGVLLINVALLRQEQDMNKLNEYIIKYNHLLILPDQDVLNALYGNKVKLVSHLLFNLSDRAILKHNLSLKNKVKIDSKWVNEHAHILHFYGKNKPWKKDYWGILKPFYEKYAHLGINPFDE